MLSLTRQDIEVVVLDNASSDQTFEELSQIIDDRLRLHRNEANMGALYNMVNALALGRGRYVVYCTDQDYFLPDGFDPFLQTLEQSADVACGHCLLPGDPPHTSRIYPTGLMAMLATAYRGRHPTGYFFRRDDLNHIDFPARFSDRTKVDLFPLEFVFAHLSLRGDALIYQHGVFRPETSVNVTKHLSSTTSGNSSTAFFSPSSRLRMAIRYAEHLDTLTLPVAHKLRVEASLFLSGLWAATLGYRAVMHNRNLCVHYRMEPEHVSPASLLRLGCNFIVHYFNGRRNARKVHDFYVGRLLAWAGCYLVRKIIQRW
jgi:glycosyltransferase involved in cell wall biosynthesis